MDRWCRQRGIIGLGVTIYISWIIIFVVVWRIISFESPSWEMRAVVRVWRWGFMEGPTLAMVSRIMWRVVSVIVKLWSWRRVERKEMKGRRCGRTVVMSVMFVTLRWSVSIAVPRAFQSVLVRSSRIADSGAKPNSRPCVEDRRVWVGDG